MQTKVCTKCGEEKPATTEYFYRSKDCAGGLKSHCKECGRREAVGWGRVNAQAVRDRAAKWRKDNPARSKQAQISHYRKNKEKILRYRSLRYKRSLQVRVASLNCSTRNNALKSQRVPKTGSFSKYLGATTEKFMDHLASQFLPGMTWENRGRLQTGKLVWQCDHIIPVLSKAEGNYLFDLSEEEDRKVAFHYLNTRPVWGSHNRDKSNRLPYWDELPPELQAICTPRIKALLRKVEIYA